MVKRGRVLAGGLALALSAALPGQIASAAQERQYVYLATADTETWSGAFALTPTAKGELAPFGSIAVTAAATRLTIRLDDTGTDDGLSIPVRVFDGRWQVFAGCAPVRTPITVAHVHPNQDLLIQVGEHVVDPLLSDLTVALQCSALGSGGIATVGGVR